MTKEEILAYKGKYVGTFRYKKLVIDSAPIILPNGEDDGCDYHYEDREMEIDTRDLAIYFNIGFKQMEEIVDFLDLDALEDDEYFQEYLTELASNTLWDTYKNYI